MRITYGKEPERADRCRLGYTAYTIVLTSAVFPERYTAILLGEVRWLERVLVLEFSMQRFTVAQRGDARYKKNQKPPHLGSHHRFDCREHVSNLNSELGFTACARGR